MSRFHRRFVATVFALFVAGGIGFGASEAFGSNPSSGDYCTEEYGDLGCCPPFTGYTCWEECVDLGYHDGFCIRIEEPQEDCRLCCTCLF